MRMMEGENIVQYCTRFKEVFNAIRGANGEIKDETMISKVLRTLLPIYSIRVSTISNNLTLEGVIGRLTSFEMSNFDSYTPATIIFAFMSQLLLSKKKGKHVKSESDSSNDDIDELEAFIAKIFGRGRGK